MAQPKKCSQKSLASPVFSSVAVKHTNKAHWAKKLIITVTEAATTNQLPQSGTRWAN
jgi:hypothetical protein